MSERIRKLSPVPVSNRRLYYFPAKDLGIVTVAAREAGVTTRLGALVAQLMASVRANGDGGRDHPPCFVASNDCPGRTPK